MTEITDIGTHPGFFVWHRCYSVTKSINLDVNLLIFGLEMIPGCSSVINFIHALMLQSSMIVIVIKKCLLETKVQCDEYAVIIFIHILCIYKHNTTT